MIIKSFIQIIKAVMKDRPHMADAYLKKWVEMDVAARTHEVKKVCGFLRGNGAAAEIRKHICFTLVIVDPDGVVSY